MGIVYAAYDEQLDRRVALKLLTHDAHETHGSAAAAQRLLREAQAMAKLSHPNVVAAFDVGTYGEQVFIAMEYVDGATLRVWRDSAPRTTSQIVAMYAQAGRGLEAAHAAGILHRDFKPENAIVDARGRVRVLDFGLARIDTPPPSLHSGDLEQTSAFKAPLPPITRYGALMGTPAYMAPEQLAGEWAEAHSDQFSFCVALYEALYGERPHAGGTVRELRSAIEANEVRPVTTTSSVPRTVRAVLLRGLRAKPAERYASMTELLAALDDALPLRRRRLVLLAGSVALAAIVAVAVAIRPARAPLCAGADREISAAWGDARRDATRRAFIASGNPRAVDAWERVRGALDGYAAGWADMRTESCQATRVRGVQSDEALDLRTACLDQRRRELAATVDLLEGANAKLVDRAVAMARDLPDLAECADVAWLRAPYAAPHDPAQRRVVDSVHQQLAQATALFNARHLDDAERLVASATSDATGMQNRALVAEAGFLAARIQLARGHDKQAAVTLRGAALEANVARDELAEARAWTWLVRIVGYDIGDFAQSQIYADIAQATIDRIHGGDGLRAVLTRHRAHAFLAHGDNDAAEKAYREALTLFTRAEGGVSPDVTTVKGDLADLLANQGHYRAAMEMARSAAADRRTLFGEDPGYGNFKLRIGLLELELGDPVAATADVTRAIELLGEDATRAEARLRLAEALILEGETDKGMAEAQGAFAEEEKARGKDSWYLGGFHGNFAGTLLRHHLNAAAAAEAAIAIGILAKTDDADDLRDARQIEALMLARLGHAADALPKADASVAAEEKAASATSPRLIVPLLAVGEASLALGDAPRALAALERAAAIVENAEGFPEQHADVHLALARALVATHGDLSRARVLGERAAREYEEGRLGELAKVARGVAPDGSAL
jgi:predicted Ser/Thr protein kinase